MITSRTTLIVLQLIVAIGAIPAGLSMVINPDGSDLGISLDILDGTPFSNFFIPGLFLLLIIGVGQLIATILTFRNSGYVRQVVIWLGVLLMLWIIVQLFFIGYQSFLQPLFFLIGVIETWLGIKTKKIKT